jgi:tRNA U34 5-methylaminomethyl-2-thiouridine-forming methyltransferase MnmC
MMNELKIITTEDGSHSLYNTNLKETYHSFHGAVQESKYVFIKQGLDYLRSNSELKQINVLEVGFGTGLNAVLTAEWARENEVKVNFTTLEPFPVSEDIFIALNYSQFFTRSEIQKDFLALHYAEWEGWFMLSPFFSMLKTEKKLQGFESEGTFDIIFFDAFAPNKQAELWAFDTLAKTVGFLSKGGVLVTYCAQGQFKSDLASLNLLIQTLPGPPGKKEMVRGLNVGE